METVVRTNTSRYQRYAAHAIGLGVVLSLAACGGGSGLPNDSRLGNTEISDVVAPAPAPAPVPDPPPVVKAPPRVVQAPPRVVQAPPPPAPDPVSLSDALDALSKSKPVSGSLSQSSSDNHVTLGASWDKGNHMPSFTARYPADSRSTLSFSEGGSGWGPLARLNNKGGSLIHESIQGATLSRRVGSGTLTIDAYSDVVTKSIQLGSWNDGTQDVAANTQIYDYSDPNKNSADRTMTNDDDMVIVIPVITHWGRLEDGGRRKRGRFYCTEGRCTVENGGKLQNSACTAPPCWKFTPDRPPGALDVTDGNTIRWFGGNFAARLGEHHMGKLPGTRDGVEGFFRCLGPNSCSSGVGNQNGEIGPYTNLSGNWIFVPTSISVRSNPDYMTFGNWIMEPDDTVNGIYESGLYATGTKPFDYRDFDALEGFATYEGAVVGTATYTKGDYSESSRMAGRVTLGAVFADENRSGQVNPAKFSAMSSNFFQDAELTFLGDDKDIMPEPGFSFGGSVSTQSHFLNLDTGRTFSNLAGEWSGKFYGVAANGKPNGIAGLVNASQTDGDQSISINGAFGAYCFSDCGNFR